MFGDFTFASIEGIIKDQVIQVMPSRDPSDNSVVLYLQMGKWDQTKFTIHQVYRTVVFVEEILLLRFFYLKLHQGSSDHQVRPGTEMGSADLVR